MCPDTRSVACLVAHCLDRAGRCLRQCRDERPQRLDVDWLARLLDGAEFHDGPAATADQDGFAGFRPRDQVAEMRLGLGDVDLALACFLTNLLIGSCRACDRVPWSDA